MKDQRSGDEPAHEHDENNVDDNRPVDDLPVLRRFAACGSAGFPEQCFPQIRCPFRRPVARAALAQPRDDLRYGTVEQSPQA
ncbi:hypothetical protein [Breoghania sp.]|uniref:hypothetical protein n=1 Tax=Breoghania sp. TaxID=2065378 RepID=UPI002629994C|nr:hypothetical protein [Breoghania sp.]MDJ0933225.1 hypothetical protein [Breoghania sp.]